MAGINFPDNVVAVAIIVFGAIMVTAIGLIWGRKPKKSENAQPSEESKHVAREDLAVVVAAAVSTAVSELVRPLSEAVGNNTAAVGHLEVALTRQNGKIENILGNTNLLLQSKHAGDGRGC